MADIEIPKGDKGFNLVFTVQDTDGAAYNLTGYTITFKVWSPNDPATDLLGGTCTILSAANGTCYYPVVASDFDITGEYSGELELTKVNTIESTKKFTVAVKESA